MLVDLTDQGVAHQLLEWMILARAVDARLCMLDQQGHLRCRFLSSAGRETVPVAVALAAQPDDPLCPLHGDIGAHLVRGTTVESILVHYMDKASGRSNLEGDPHMNQWGRRMFPLVSRLPTSGPALAGLGLASTLDGDQEVTIAFCRDGAASTGAWHDTLNLVSGFNTPNVFVVESNGWADSPRVSRKPQGPSLAAQAAAYGLPIVRVDGNEALAVHEAASAAIARARSGGGPTLIEAIATPLMGINHLGG